MSRLLEALKRLADAEDVPAAQPRRHETPRARGGEPGREETVPADQAPVAADESPAAEASPSPRDQASPAEPRLSGVARAASEAQLAEDQAARGGQHPDSADAKAHVRKDTAVYRRRSFARLSHDDEPDRPAADPSEPADLPRHPSGVLDPWLTEPFPAPGDDAEPTAACEDLDVASAEAHPAPEKLEPRSDPPLAGTTAWPESQPGEEDRHRSGAGEEAIEESVPPGLVQDAAPHAPVEESAADLHTQPSGRAEGDLTDTAAPEPNTAPEKANAAPAGRSDQPDRGTRDHKTEAQPSTEIEAPASLPLQTPQPGPAESETVRRDSSPLLDGQAQLVAKLLDLAKRGPLGLTLIGVDRLAKYSLDVDSLAAALTGASNAGNAEQQSGRQALLLDVAASGEGADPLVLQHGHWPEASLAQPPRDLVELAQAGDQEKSVARLRLSRPVTKPAGIDPLLIAQCKRRYGIVLAMVAGHDQALARSLACQADVVLLLATAGHSSKEAASDIAAQLRVAGIEPDGCILTLPDGVPIR